MAATVTALAAALAAQAPVGYDLVIRGGRVLDGAGNPWVLADVAVRQDASRGDRPEPRGQGAARDRRPRPGGLARLHRHRTRTPGAASSRCPTADNYVAAGRDDDLRGPGRQLAGAARGRSSSKIAALGISPNWGMFVGQGSVREAVIGRADRKATPDEIARMKELVRQGMLDGAFGLSTGLFYVPGIFTPTDEVIALATVAGEMGGIHVSHMRNEASRRHRQRARRRSRSASRARLPTQITHHKIIGTPNWGRSVETLKLVDEARARGVDVTIDQYPYTASSTGINALLPPWALEGRQADVVARLRDPAQRAQDQGGDRRVPRCTTAAAAIRRTCRSRRAPGIRRSPARTSPTSPARAAPNPRSRTPPRRRCGSSSRAARRDLPRHRRGGPRAHPPRPGHDDRVRRRGADLRRRRRRIRAATARSCACSAATCASGSVLTLADAVRKMTSFPAQRVGLHDRGVLRPGMKADIAVWDAAAIARHGDVRAAAPVRRRRAHGDRQRPDRVRERRDDAGPARPRALRPGVPGGPLTAWLERIAPMKQGAAPGSSSIAVAAAAAAVTVSTSSEPVARDARHGGVAGRHRVEGRRRRAEGRRQRRSTRPSRRPSRWPSCTRPPATSAAAGSSSTARPTGEPVAYDFREMAPAARHADDVPDRREVRRRQAPRQLPVGRRAGHRRRPAPGVEGARASCRGSGWSSRPSRWPATGSR